MFVHLLQQVFKGRLYRTGGSRSAFCTAICPEGKRRLRDTLVPSRGDTSSTIPFRWTQSGRNTCRRFSQLFDLMLNIFFNGGIFGKTIADVNVHERLGLANEVAQPSAF